MSFCISLQNFIQIGPPTAEKWRRRFSRWRISAILDFRGPIMGSLKSQCASSIETVALLLSFSENRVFAFWRQTDKQMDKSVALSRCRERQLNKQNSQCKTWFMHEKVEPNNIWLKKVGGHDPWPRVSLSAVTTVLQRSCQSIDAARSWILVIQSRQEAQLLQRDRATLRVIEYFAKSLGVIWNDTTVCKSLLEFHWNYVNLVPFLRYSASKNGVTLKPWVGVDQGHWKWRRSIDHIRLSVGRPLYV